MVTEMHKHLYAQWIFKVSAETEQISQSSLTVNLMKICLAVFDLLYAYGNRERGILTGILQEHDCT
jgi:hypothetical protein